MRKAVQVKRNQGFQAALPYLFQYYNVMVKYPGLATRGIARILNPLVEALNKQHQTQKYLILVPDKDLITSLQMYNFGAGRVMGTTLHYIIKQIDLLLERRRRDLTEKRPGALLNGYPLVIWIRMIKRPKELSNIAPFNLRGKFNSILEERLRDATDHHRIISIEVQADEFNHKHEMEFLE